MFTRVAAFVELQATTVLNGEAGGLASVEAQVETECATVNEEITSELCIIVRRVVIAHLTLKREIMGSFDDDCARTDEISVILAVVAVIVDRERVRTNINRDDLSVEVLATSENLADRFVGGQPPSGVATLTEEDVLVAIKNTVGLKGAAPDSDSTGGVIISGQSGCSRPADGENIGSEDLRADSKVLVP